jgi:hypothetical protein
LIVSRSPFWGLRKEATLQELHNPDSVLRFAGRFTEKPGRLKHRDETSLVYSHTDRQSKEAQLPSREPHEMRGLSHEIKGEIELE